MKIGLIPLIAQSLNNAVKAFDRRLIEEAIRRSNGNKQRAAESLGLSRQGLVKKMKPSGATV